MSDADRAKLAEKVLDIAVMMAPETQLKIADLIIAEMEAARAGAIEECAKAVRDKCGPCGGKGGGYDGECEYCGRPIRAIRRLLLDSAGGGCGCSPLHGPCPKHSTEGKWRIKP